MEISATFIRQSVALKKDIRFLMPDKAWKYMNEMHFYE
jgi:nicotinate-nucleotide adenylyltransferase